MNVLQRCDGGCRGPTKMISCVLFIALLVFGVNVATADDTATSSSTEMTTAVTPSFRCNAIPEGISTEIIIDHCTGGKTTIKTKQGMMVLFDVSNLSQDKVNNFFASISVAFHLNFRMENNDQIATLDFGKVTEFSDNEFSIINNRKLESIEGISHLIFDNKNIIIRGNRLLSEESIKKLRTMAGTLDVDIQEAHECSQTDPDFTECERIYGYLVLTDFSQQTNPKFKPKAVSGCLKLTKTNVDLNVTDFLKDLNFSKLDCTGTNEITGYCIMEKDQKDFDKKFNNSVVITNKYVCEQKDIFDYLQKKCKTIRGDITVTSTWNETQLDLLSSVQTVNGSVKIDGVDGSKIGGKLTFFAGLHYINSPNSNAPALTITNNIKASEITLNLKKIGPKRNNLLKYEKNSFNCSSDQRNQLGTAMDVEVVICAGEEVLPPPPSAGNGTRNGTDGQLTVTEANQGNENEGYFQIEKKMRSEQSSECVTSLAKQGSTRNSVEDKEILGGLGGDSCVSKVAEYGQKERKSVDEKHLNNNKRSIFSLKLLVKYLCCHFMIFP